jgi:hypothetical protein
MGRGFLDKSTAFYNFSHYIRGKPAPPPFIMGWGFEKITGGKKNDKDASARESSQKKIRRGENNAAKSHPLSAAHNSVCGGQLPETPNAGKKTAPTGWTLEPPM